MPRTFQSKSKHEEVAKRIVYGDKSYPVYDELYKNYIISLLRDLKIINALDFKRKTGLTLKHIGKGLDRVAYQIESSNLVVKFCRYETDRIDKSGQSYVEHYAYKAIMRLSKYKYLRQYMPEIYYFNPKTGVTLMKKYTKLTHKEWRKLTLQIDIIDAVVAKTVGDKIDTDLHEHNLGRDTDGSLKIIDLGMLYLY